MTKLAIIPILVVLLLIFSKNTEKFNTNLILQQPQYIKPEIKILNLEQVKDFISSDEDNFIASLTVYDLRARKSGSYLEYRNKCVSSINFILDTKIIKKIQDVCELADTLLKNSYSELYTLNWNIALVTGNIYEGGYPHTREDIIFLPFDFLIHADTRSIVKTLIHEKIHVLQRMYPDSKLLQSFLLSNNFSKFKSLDEFRKMNVRTRSNPDLDNWIYSDGIKFYYCEYSSDFPKSIMDVIQPNENEHPFELMAYQLSNELIKNL
jgi:hypothetical protein